MKPLTPKQLAALKQLREALTSATRTGLFDSVQMWDALHPDIINNFCDGVVKVFEENPS